MTEDAVGAPGTADFYAVRLTTGHRAGYVEPKLYKALDTAQAATERRPSYELVPLVTLDRLQAQEAETRKAQALAEAETNAVRVLRGETVALRNEIATLTGRLMAKKHGHDVGGQP